MCKTRLDDFTQGEPITVRPMKAFPVMKDLVTDVKSNYAMAKKIPVFTPQANASWKWYQQDIDRVQEFRKCIQCFLCQDVCHVLREHNKHDVFAGPAFFVQVAALEMHPIDAVDRTGLLNEGLYVNLIVPPGCPQDECVLRASCSAAHTPEQIERALGILARVGAELGVTDVALS